MIDGHGDDIRKYNGIRLNFSSNVYSHFNHKGLKTWLAGTMGDIASYPEPEPLEAERAVAEAIGVSPGEVMVTNGATEAIYLIAQATAGCATAIITPTFAEYADACHMHSHKITEIRTLDELPEDTQTVWLCNPNNPTGTVMPIGVLDSWMESRRRTLFVIDASYAPFTDQPTLKAAESTKLPNVLMLHSMTKAFAVPGLRLGYITGNVNIINKVKRYRMPWSVGTVTQNACRYLMEHRDDYTIPIKELMQERGRVAKSLTALDAIEVMPSDSHILLCRWHNGTAAELKETLAQRYGILIRDASNFHGLDSRHFRIAVQTAKKNDELIKAISEITKSEEGIVKNCQIDEVNPILL